MPRTRQIERPGPALVAWLAGLLLTASAALADLAADVDRALASVELGGATVAVSIRDTATDHPLVRIADETPMIPASNMKLVTTGAALHVLGPRFEFATRLRRVGSTIVVIGDGDPAFGDPQLLEEMPWAGAVGIDVETFLDFWVAAVAEAGIERVDEVIVDDRIFDRDFVHRRWPADQLNRRYCAEVAGLSFHLNVLHFFPRPGSGARPVVSDYRPHVTGLNVRNDATNRTGPKDRNTVWIARAPGTNVFEVHGNVKHAHRVPVAVTFNSPPTLFAGVLADRLRKAGVTVASHRVSAAGDPDFAEAGTPIGPIITSPMSTVITRCNRDSQNLYAEALLKRIGHEMTGRPGNWRDGAAIIRHVVYERVGEPGLTMNLVVSDGSGLSRDNRISAATLTAWLATFRRDRTLGPVYLASLARPGDPGTLQKRFRGVDLRGAEVRAKSGFINGVSCLSGYVIAPDGRCRSFSILVNALAVSTARAKTLQERIVAAVAKDLAAAEVTLGSD
ncbi:MAG: D-alanyl-D-alanine carboxypeptidase/D-alanyl-D-alanine endopeptidase [Planctomycetota bacterium]|jgi:D-alanyl-D-alanine carboxypeptidase/D-alanyl-D-alanine-endopeptidase (penicillin-binding protein 4)